MRLGINEPALGLGTAKITFIDSVRLSIYFYLFIYLLILFKNSISSFSELWQDIVWCAVYQAAWIMDCHPKYQAIQVMDFHPMTSQDQLLLGSE